MGVTISNSITSPQAQVGSFQNPTGEAVFRRKLFITDINGVEHEIKTKEDLDAIFAQMTPEQKSDWELRYRFSPILNRTGIKDYTGTNYDI